MKIKKKIIGVIGEETASPYIKELAYQVGRLIAEAGYILVCGGLGGVMEEACRGAKEAGGITIGILPGTSQENSNPYVDIPIPTGFDQARNIIIIRTSAAVIAIGGGYGTLSEIAYALKLNIPVIGLDTWQLSKKDYENVPIIRVKTAQEAVNTALELIEE